MADSFLATLSSVVRRGGGGGLLVWLEGADSADPFCIGWLLLLSRSRTGTSSTGAVAVDALGVV